VMVASRDSGFTGTTISTTLGATPHCVIGIELDASGAASVTPRLALLGVGV
jgi:hypothetical protein